MAEAGVLERKICKYINWFTDGTALAALQGSFCNGRSGRFAHTSLVGLDQGSRDMDYVKPVDLAICLTHKPRKAAPAPLTAAIQVPAE